MDTCNAHAAIVADFQAKMDAIRKGLDERHQHSDDWYHWLRADSDVTHQQQIERIRLIGVRNMPLADRLEFTKRQAMVHRPIEPQQRWTFQAPFTRIRCWDGCSHYNCERCGLDVEIWEAYEQ